MCARHRGVAASSKESLRWSCSRSHLLSCYCAVQEQQAAKAEAYKLQTTVLDQDAALQRKDVEVTREDS